MDRTGDAVELLVEHATDFRMCDLLDEAAPINPGSSGGSGPAGNLRKSTEDPTSGLAPGNIISVCHLNAIEIPLCHPHMHTKCYSLKAI